MHRRGFDQISSPTLTPYSLSPFIPPSPPSPPCLPHFKETQGFLPIFSFAPSSLSRDYGVDNLVLDLHRLEARQVRQQQHLSLAGEGVGGLGGGSKKGGWMMMEVNAEGEM